MKRNDRFAGNRRIGWRTNATQSVPDARLKIIVRQNARLKDARDRLNMIAKRTDARQKLLKLKANKTNRKKLQSPNIALTRTIRFGNNSLQGPLKQNISFASPLLQRTISGNARIENRLGLESKGRSYLSDVGQRSSFQKGSYRVVSGSKGLTVTATNDTTEHLDGLADEEDDLEHMTLDDLPNIKQLKPDLLASQPSSFPPLNLSTSLQSRLSPLDNSSSSQGFKVIVSNLHTDVTQDDIQELFGEIGMLRKALLNKHGFAEVTFFELADAIKACEVYNNRQLDGKPMHVKLITTGNYGHVQAPPTTSYMDTARPKVSPDIDVIRRALFRKGTPASSGLQQQQPLFTITMANK